MGSAKRIAKNFLAHGSYLLCGSPTDDSLCVSGHVRRSDVIGTASDFFPVNFWSGSKPTLPRFPVLFLFSFGMLRARLSGPSLCVRKMRSSC